MNIAPRWNIKLREQVRVLRNPISGQYSPLSYITRKICSFCICDNNMAFKHISLLSAKGVIMGYVGYTFFFLPGQNPISPGHMGDTAFLPVQKKKKKKKKKKKRHITTFGALGGLAFDSAYDIK